MTPSEVQHLFIILFHFQLIIIIIAKYYALFMFVLDKWWG